MQLKVTTCQAVNTHAPGRELTAYIGQQLGLDTEFVLDLPWPERRRGLLTGEIHVGWICGMWYVQQNVEPTPPLELLATPVYQHTRYQDRPVYFSDVVVHQNSSFHRFSDLRGATWAINEPDSLSGHHVIRQALVERGETTEFLGPLVASGSHLSSLGMVRSGRVSAAAIDSTLMDYVKLTSPERLRGIRVLLALGPNPAPPWVVSRQLSADLRTRMRKELLAMHNRPAGKAVLMANGLNRFAPVTDRDYARLSQPP